LELPVSARIGGVAVGHKTNEITELLRMLDIDNSIITLDAMGCRENLKRGGIKWNAKVSQVKYSFNTAM